MENNFYAVGYHGTNKIYVDNIVDSTNFKLNSGDEFLGEGFFVWRDSYDRAYRWAKKRNDIEDISVIYVKIQGIKDNCLNFTSFNWNNESELIQIYLEDFKNYSFGEYIDFLISNEVEIDAVIIADLTDDYTIIPIKDGTTHFAQVDIQICLKNKEFIDDIKGINNESK